MIQDRLLTTDTKIEKLKESLEHYCEEVARLKLQVQALSQSKADKLKEGFDKGLVDLRTWLQDQQMSKRKTRDYYAKYKETKDPSYSIRSNKITRTKPQSVEAKQKPDMLKSTVSTDELLRNLNFKKALKYKHFWDK